MTEQEMKERMKQIDKERDALRFEKEKYEKYFSNKRREQALENNKTYIGKCFITRGMSDNEQKYIKAFKILEILDNPNESYALCEVLIDGCRYTCFKEYGIQIMTLGLWTHNNLRLMNKESDPNMIDFYKEISEDEFQKLYTEHLNNIKKSK